MAEFALTFKNFGLFVSRPGGMTVILGASFHHLAFTGPDGAIRDIEPGSEIILTRAGVTSQEPTIPPAGVFVGDLARLLGKPVSVPDQLLTGPVEPGLVNARVVLSGGSCEELRCTIPPWDTWPYQFPSGPHLTTDTVVFHHTAAMDETYELRAGGEVLAELGPGSTALFMNNDDEDAPYQPFGSLKEFCEMCRISAVDCPADVTALPGFEEVVLRRDHWLSHPATQEQLRGAMVGGLDLFGFHRVCANFQAKAAI